MVLSAPSLLMPTFNARLVEIERGLAGRTTTGWLINIRQLFISKHEWKWTDLPLN